MSKNQNKYKVAQLLCENFINNMNVLLAYKFD